MKSALALSLLTVLLAPLAKADEAKILAKGADCGVVDISSVSLRQIGHGEGVALMVSIQNLGRDKEIYLHKSTDRDHTQWDKADWNSPSYQAIVAARWLGTDGRFSERDVISLTDQRWYSGNDEATLDLYVKMNGQQYSCTGVKFRR